MKLSKRITFLFFFFLPILFFAGDADAITLSNGKWSTTFNCNDWARPSDGPDTGCDGISRDLDGASGYVSSITSAANYPGGAGGKGFSWQIGNGPGDSATSPTSANLALSWGGSNHVWIRWYVRIPQGLDISYGSRCIQGWKVLYVWSPSRNADQSLYIDANYQGVGMTLYDRTSRANGQYGFSDAIGSNTSDGSWVAVEMEFDIPNRTWRYWFYEDNVDSPTPKFQSSSINYPMSSIGFISIPDNIRSSACPNVPQSLYFDDITISTTGRIGPASGSGGTPTCSNCCSTSQTCPTAFTTVGTCARCCATACQTASTDTTAPRVTAFTITPTTLTVGASLTANYTVTDNTALARAELWRAPSGTNCTDTVKTGCVWTQVTSANITGTSRTGTFTSSPTAAGTFYYGLHAVDAANNVGYEPAPVRVTINAPTQTCSNCCSTTQTCPTAMTTVGTCTRCCATTCQTASACGNGSCETGETCSSCASDCGACAGGSLLVEPFDNNSFSSRGWFDGSSMALDSSTKYSGNSSARWSWTAGASTPTNSPTLRHDITPTDSLYLSFYWRFNSDWGGSSDLGYQPHLIYVLSDMDDRWGGLASNYLDTYIQVTDTTPVVQIQDGKNINTNPTPPWTSTMGNENRAVAGCNGTLSGSDPGNLSDCYSSGSWMNYRRWNGSTGNMSKGSWHHVEVYLKMNTVTGGVAQPNGTTKMWINGVQSINKNNVVFRTGNHPNLKWATFVIAPYLGSSPKAQTMWMDELTVGTSDPYAGGTPTCSNCCSTTQTCPTAFTTIGTCTRCCSTACQTASTDTTAPGVTAFTITPTTLTVGASLTANYTVTDNTALARAELWRAPQGTNCTDTVKTGCVWTQVTSANITGTSRTGTFTSSPTAAGTFYYGLHAVDTSNNVGYESAAVRVTVNAQTQTCTNCCSTTQTCPTAMTTVGTCTRCCASTCQTASACGNGNCETGETCSSCASDCGACPGGQCQKIASGAAIPSGYGAPYNTLSVSGEQLMNVVCNANSASVSIGNNSTSQYIYRYGYIWRNNAWQRIDLTGPVPAYEGNWFRGSANATVSLTATWNGTAWRCGCRDSACTTPYWQLQRFGNY